MVQDRATALRRERLPPTAVIFIGNLVARALGFLFPVIVARLLGRDDFAIAAFVISTGFFAGELILTGYPTALTRAIASEPSDDRRASWVASAMVGGVPLLIGACVLAGVLAVGGSAPAALVILVVIGLTIDAYYFSLLRGLRRFTWLAIYRVSANLAQILLLLVAAAAGWTSLGLVVAIYAAVYVVPMIVIEHYDHPIASALTGRFRADRERLRSLTAFAIPALVSGVAYGAIFGFDVFFVRVFAPAELADYAAARALAVPMFLVPYALAVVLMPRAAAASRIERRGILIRALVIGIGASVAGWLGYVLLGAQLVDVVFPPEYAAARSPLTTLIPGVALLGVYSLVSQWTLGIGRPYVAATSLSAGALTTILAHLVLTASLGSVGAGLAIALGAGVALSIIGISAYRWLGAPTREGTPTG